MVENRIENQEPLSDGEGEPECFGDPQKVCPVDESGVMQPQTSCLGCGRLKPCLQEALRKRGVISRPLAETPAVSKMTNFLKRWSNQKMGCVKSSREDAAD